MQKLKINHRDYTFIVPLNDGESKKIVDLCRSLHLDLRVSPQKWGAVLDKEGPETFKGILKNVVIVEIPGKEKEAELIRKGHNLVIIDHHLYNDGQEVLDRRHDISSLEQFAELIGHSLNRFERGIALNDRGYIWLLRKEGYSTREIDEIRQYDLKAQGYKNDELARSVDDYESGSVYDEKKTYIVNTHLHKVAYISDIHYLRAKSTQNLLTFTQSYDRLTEVNFFGSPGISKKLFSRFGGWSGGNELVSMFWGCSKNVPHRDEVLNAL